MERLEFDDKTIAELYKFLGALTLFVAAIFFFDGIINLQLIDNIVIQAFQPETLTRAIFGTVNLGNLLLVLSISFVFLVLGIITILRGILIQYRKT